MIDILRKMFQPRKPGRLVEPSGAVPLSGSRTDPSACALFKSQGNAFLAKGQLEEALQCYRQASLADPGDAAALVNMAYVFSERQDGVQARVALERALQLDANQFDAHFMLATLTQAQGDSVSASLHLREVMRLQPDFDFMAYVPYEAGYEQAIARYQMILDIKPDHAGAHWGLGMTRLLLGDYAEGWKEWEWRLKAEGGFPRGGSGLTQPAWLGMESVEGKTILLHSEYGYGDTLQFCRYAPEVADLGARVVLQVQPSLVSLLSCMGDRIQVVGHGDSLPAFDFHCPLMSLPLALGHHEDEIASARSPYLQADPVRVQQWRKRIAGMGLPDGERIGMVCAGNAAHVRDSQRSIALRELLKVLPPGVRGVYLQPELRETDRAAVDVERLICLGDDISNFADTAALIEVLDLVVTVDTSVAHLAGALGKPVWILLPHVPDWRWLLGREDSPWYPSARLFRQHVVDDWGHVLERVRQALGEQLSAGKRSGRAMGEG